MRLFPLALILLLAWSALAFGGSLTWSAASTLALCVTTAALAFLESRAQLRYHSIAAALLLVLVSIAFQLVPLKSELTQRLSPARDDANFELLLATADRQDLAFVDRSADRPAPLSIASSRTKLGLAAFAGLALLLVGASRGFSTVGTRDIARGTTAVGIAVALVGLYQLTAATNIVYGWYPPLFADGKSAPFINPNHQAGWLVMAVSLSLGAFAGEVSRGMRGVAPRSRDRVLWFSSKDASIAVLLLFASAVMAVSILATRARSGAAAMILSFLVVAIWSSRKQPSGPRRMVAGAGLILLTLMVLGFNGGAVLMEIAATEGAGTRVPIWDDTLRIARDFWMTGTGFNTYGAAMLHYQTVNDGYRYVEAHNDYLQLAAEGGLLVGIPFLILAIVSVREIWLRFHEAADDTRTYWLRVGAVTGLIAIALQAIVDFTLQMPGGAAMFTTLLAIAIHHPPPRSSREQGAREHA